MNYLLCLFNKIGITVGFYNIFHSNRFLFAVFGVTGGVVSVPLAATAQDVIGVVPDKFALETLAALPDRSGSLHKAVAMAGTEATDRASAEGSAYRLSSSGTGVATRHKPVAWRQVRDAEIAFQVLHVTDAALTWHCLDNHQCHENNPFLGRHPSREAIAGFTLGTGILHVMLTRILMREEPAMVRPWQYITLGLKGATVAWNVHVCL